MKRNNEPKFYPLCEAVINDDMETFNALLESGVDIDGTDYNSITALCYAVQRGRLLMVKKLLERGANIEFKDPYGNTPLSTAVFYTGRNENGLEIVNLLLSYGANINAENNYGISPKSLANTITGFPIIDAFKE